MKKLIYELSLAHIRSLATDTAWGINGSTEKSDLHQILHKHHQRKSVHKAS